jgi:hypothetical protein
MKEFGQFVKAVSSHWLEIVGGAIMSVFFFALNGVGIADVPPWVYGLCTGAGFFAACFRAWLDKRKSEDKLAQEILELNAKLDQKKLRETHKNLLAAAMHTVKSRMVEVQEVNPNTTTKKQMDEEWAKTDGIVFKVLDSLTPLGKGEQDLIGLAESRPINVASAVIASSGSNGKERLGVELDKGRLIAALQGRMDAIRARLERM